MPIYEYECLKNKHRFEVIQKFTDPPVTKCSICGEPVQKLFSAPAIQFKGTGWYITDYARKGDGKKDGKSENAAKSDGRGTEKSSETSETKTDSKKADTPSSSNSTETKS
jgi:putative FmdB family regulatory protein